MVYLVKLCKIENTNNNKITIRMAQYNESLSIFYDDFYCPRSRCLLCYIMNNVYHPSEYGILCKNHHNKYKCVNCNVGHIGIKIYNVNRFTNTYRISLFPTCSHCKFTDDITTENNTTQTQTSTAQTTTQPITQAVAQTTTQTNLPTTNTKRTFATLIQLDNNPQIETEHSPKNTNISTKNTQALV